MPVQTSYPGVYVQEVPSGVRTIAGVSTSVAAFLGRAKWGPVNTPFLCLSYSDFERTYTSDTTSGDLARYVRLFFLNGGTRCYIMRLADEGTALAATTTLDDSAPAATLTVQGRYPGDLGDSLRVEITAASATEFNLTLYRLVKNKNGVDTETDKQTFSGLSMDPLHPRFAITYVNYPWATLSRPGTSILPPVATVSALVLTPGNDGAALTAPDFEAAYPVLEKEVDIFNLLILPPNNGGPAQADLWSEASDFCNSRRAFLLMDPKTTWTTAAEATNPTTGIASLRTGLVKDHSAVFFPRITVNENGTSVQVGASGAIAGLMARTDANRGVWKAPAGTEADLRGITGLEYKFTDQENGVMNPHAVNTIRIFPNGIVNWGARTMDGDDDFGSEYKYIPIRRTALFIEESLYRGLKWVVFEPNDEPLWSQIRLNVGAFMHELFRQGAFQGKTKQDAYFVKCDSETTTQNDINLGIVNVWVGFAPLKPAEFVVLYLQQMTGQIQV